MHWPGLLSAALVTGAAAAPPLPQLNIDRAAISVSGLSSGGFMAVQLGYAHAATFMGVGVFAGGPYRCAGQQRYAKCMDNAGIGSAALAAMQADIDRWSGGANDARAFVARQKVYLFVGTADTTVGPQPMQTLAAQYVANGAAGIQSVTRAGTAHVFPTDFDAPGNTACGKSDPPFVANCGHDGARAVLTAIYGALAPRNDAPAPARYVEFDQTAFTTSPGMAATGWLYVPATCAAGARCRLHVALHGCKQTHASIGDRFIRDTGYTRWADSNRIVVLFPQARADLVPRQTAASGWLWNANGCWDWIGWYGDGYAQRSGTQVAAILAMVTRIAGGGTALPAPAAVATSNAAPTAMSVGWNAVPGAAGYRLYRGGSAINATPVAGTSTTDAGLEPATRYSWTVAALDATGAPGAMSAPAGGATTGTACFSASNHAHAVADRAHVRFGLVYANGSNQNIGWWNIFTMTTLKRTAANHYAVGSC